MARVVLVVFLVFAFLEVVNSGGFVEKKIEKEFKDLLKKDDGRARAEEMTGLFEGDIDMDENMKRALIGGKISSRDAIIKPIYHWPNGKLYFKFHSSISDYTRHRIYLAMEHIKKYTCIKFERYQDQPLTNYVIFFKGRGCYSRVGRNPNGNSQKISIGRGCTLLGTIVHEIMHSLGFFHEQSRQDRDDFIKIIWKNIGKRHAHNFRKYPRMLGSSLGKPYDYLSVMHYSKYAFSMNHQATIVPMKKHAVIGQRYGLSFYDAFQINKLYKCQPLCRDILDPFVCEHFKAIGHCHSYSFSKYMDYVCKRTCTNCGHHRDHWS